MICLICMHTFFGLSGVASTSQASDQYSCHTKDSSNVLCCLLDWFTMWFVTDMVTHCGHLTIGADRQSRFALSPGGGMEVDCERCVLC